MRFRRAALRHPFQVQVLKTGLHSLAEELVQEVLHYLHWPTDFYNLSLVCRMLYRLATQELYSTLVIAYHRPERITALLSLLQTKPERRSTITTLIFDEDVKSIGPRLPTTTRWPLPARRRELTDGWDPRRPGDQPGELYPHNRHYEAIAEQLHDVLLALPNLKRVIIRSLHPIYMRSRPSEDHVDHPPLESLPTIGSNAAHSLSTWESIFMESPMISELFTRGLMRHLPTAPMLQRLTAVCISDLYFHTPGHALQVHAWNSLLSQAPNLKTLGMINVELAYAILDQRFFPSLEALELWRIFLGHPYEPNSRVFLEFLRRHSVTLRVLALSPVLWGHVNHGLWLKDRDILPNLHTLRVDHAFALFGPTEAYNPLTTDDNKTAAQRITKTQAQRTLIFIKFIAHRPHIIDLAIPGLLSPLADNFAKSLTATRPMRRVFIGEVASRSLAVHMSFTEQLRSYSYEAWSFYTLFGGLTITRSGFRPKLPSQRWKFWKRKILC